MLAGFKLEVLPSSSTADRLAGAAGALTGVCGGRPGMSLGPLVTAAAEPPEEEQGCPGLVAFSNSPPLR